MGNSEDANFVKIFGLSTSNIGFLWILIENKHQDFEKIPEPEPTREFIPWRKLFDEKMKNEPVC